MKKGFTLIELLIVVAIIAILAAIAVPNFLEAQTRSKVSRVKADMRTQATAMETYFVDWNNYTRDSDSSLDVDNVAIIPDYQQRANGVTQLTTPVGYITALLSDPFSVGTKPRVDGGVANGYRIGSGSWSYKSAVPVGNDGQDSFAIGAAAGKISCFVMLSPGPDQERNRIGYKCFPYQPAVAGCEGPAGNAANGWGDVIKNGQDGGYTDYDPTNGTSSSGDIYQFGGSYISGHYVRNGVEVGSNNPNVATAF